VPLGADRKSATLSTPENLLTRILNERRSCFVLSEDVRNIKTFLNIRIKHSQSKKVLVFYSRLYVLLFLLVRHLAHHFSSYFSVFLKYASMDPAHSVEFSFLFPVGFQFVVSRTTQH